jgi:hypothetical protein
MLRLITDGRISPEEAVRAYHGVLQGKNIRPKLPLEKDLELTDLSMSYDGTAAARATCPSSPPPRPPVRLARLPKGAPDFEGMTKEQRRAYDKASIDAQIRLTLFPKVNNQSEP